MANVKYGENFHENVFIEKPRVVVHLKKKESKKDQAVVLISASVCGIIIGMNWIAFPVFYVEFSEYFGESKFITGGIGSVQLAVSQFLGIVVSAPIDVYGCCPVAMCGGVLLCLGYVISSFASSIIHLYISYGLIGGIGLSLLNLPSHVIIQQHFDKNRSLATTIIMMSRSLGHLLGPIVIEYLIIKFTWRGALLIYGAIILNALAFAGGFSPARSFKPSSKKGINEILKRLVDFSIFKEITFLLFCLSMFFASFNRIGFYHHLPSRMVYYGTSKLAAAWMLTIASTCAIIFRLGAGVIANLQCSDRTIMYTVSVIVSGLATLLLPLTNNYIVAVVIVATYGGFRGTTMLIMNIALADLFGVEKYARSKGLLNVCSGIAGSIATPFSGWLFDISQNYNIPFFVCGFIGLTGGVIACLVVIINRKKESIHQEKTHCQQEENK